jgi:hypothetical protein
MQPKPDSAKLVDQYIANGGKIIKCPPQKVKEKTTRPVEVVEIVVEHLPPELHRFIQD